MSESNLSRQLNVDIKLSEHDAILGKKTSSGDAQSRQFGKPNNLKVFGSNEIKRPKKDNDNQVWSPIHEGGEP